MKTIFFLLILLYGCKIFAQPDSSKKITFSAYGELYYSYDFSKPANHDKPNFLYNHKRHNEINANLLLVKANYSSQPYRGNIAAMAGNYAEYNLSAEPTWAKFIYEANMGVKISNKKNIWLDAGIFPSHIGFESAISADCWTLTRSLVAENSPYYETGLKISSTSKNEKLFLSALFLNGWQKIRKPDIIQQPSFGFQATYKPSTKIILNYSNFLGTDKPDSLKSFRHYHNLYFQYESLSNFGIIAGFDAGFERTRFKKFSSWYTPVIILKQRILKHALIAVRGEYYNDKNEAIIFSGTPNGFKTFGFSSNIDVDLNEKMKWRIEGKMYHSKDKIFKNNSSTNNYSLTTNLSIRF